MKQIYARRLGHFRTRAVAHNAASLSLEYGKIRQNTAKHSKTQQNTAICSNMQGGGQSASHNTFDRISNARR